MDYIFHDIRQRKGGDGVSQFVIVSFLGPGPPFRGVEIPSTRPPATDGTPPTNQGPRAVSSARMFGRDDVV